MTTLQMLILLAGIAIITHGKTIVPTLLPASRGVWRRFAALDPRWLSFAKGALVAAVLMLFVGKVEIPWPVFPPGPPTPDVVVPDAPVKVERVTYVYEKDDGSVPSGVLTALDKLNRQGVIATAFEEDTTDGTGETPEQYKLAKTEAQKAGVPALVVQGGNRVRVVKGVTTEAQVLEVKP